MNGVQGKGSTMPLGKSTLLAARRAGLTLSDCEDETKNLADFEKKNRGFSTKKIILSKDKIF